MTIASSAPAAGGKFVRADDAFRGWVTADGRSGFPAVAGRYHLYVALCCPWAHRTVIVRALKRLEDAIGMTVLDPIRNEAGWAFSSADGCAPDPLNGFSYLSEAYHATDATYPGRVTVPVLWDTVTRTIVSNADDDIMRMFETEFDALAATDLDFYPAAIRDEIDALNEEIYESVNDGVYRAGFARSQRAYEEAAFRLFEMLDHLEARLARRRFLFGPQPVETDWRLFVTLIRFDAVYHGHFKCNLRRIVDYPHLWAYVRDLYQFRNVATTVNFDHIKRHYYRTHPELNPRGLVPVGPLLDLTAPHHRAGLA
jgi:glutathionyl-hydroquinone reductase